MGRKKFSKWAKKNGYKQCELSVYLHVVPSMISEIMSGKKHPSILLAYRIQRFTSGEVPMDSWVKK
jgi:transcriptional regulator with XRE-family HTH domain